MTIALGTIKWLVHVPTSSHLTAAFNYIYTLKHIGLKGELHCSRTTTIRMCIKCVLLKGGRALTEWLMNRGKIELCVYDIIFYPNHFPFPSINFKKRNWGQDKAGHAWDDRPKSTEKKLNGIKVDKMHDTRIVNLIRPNVAYLRHKQQ